MEKEKIFKELSNRKKILEQNGYVVLYIGLYGSQNYNCDDEESDIDVKAIILPTLHDIIFRKVTSKIIDCKNGNIDVKDLVTFYDIIKKGNFSYIESIDTEYSIGDKYIKELFRQFRPNLKSILGAMYEKRKALTHEYPSKTKEFEKWGFDPKQFHHIIRLYDLLKRGNDGASFIKYKSPFERDYMILQKRNYGNLSKEFVEQKSDEIIELSKKFIPKDYVYEVINIDNEISTFIENKLKVELTNKGTVCSAREYRTFDGGVPKKDLEKFECLRELNGQDISYIVTESIEIL